MKKILITGTGGFVGRNLAEYLPGRGAEVHAFTHHNLDLLDATAVAEKLASIKPEIVIHCASIGGTRKTAYDQQVGDVAAMNLRMFFNLERALPPGARLLQMGSGGEYDIRVYRSKMSEDYFDTSVPADPYGFSKYAISKYAARTGHVTVLRIFGLFGKYEDYTYKFISNAIAKNLLGLPIIINQNAVFDYLCMNDFLRLTDKFIECNPKFRHYNVTPTESVDLLTLAALVVAAGDKKSEVRVLNPGLNREYTGSNSRLLAEFPDLEFTAYAAAIEELYGYYRQNLDKLDVEAVKADPYLKHCRTK